MSARGITGVTHGGPDLAAPPRAEANQTWRYGLGIPFQLAPRTVGLYCNIRRLGVPCIDFEAGSDVVRMDEGGRFDPATAVPVARNHQEAHPQTGRPTILVKHVLLGGFVPLGAKLDDGRPHPHAGTGFALGPAISFAADFSQRLPGEDPHKYRFLEVHQLAYDGRTFRASAAERVAFEGLLPPWRIVNRGLGAGIPDGADLLAGLSAAAPGEGVCSGLSRWRREGGRWRPVSFTPVTPQDTSMEPNLHRDVNGALLFGARCGSHEKGPAVTHGIRVWRSADGGETWKQTVTAPSVRASTPVVLNQAADGTPYVAANRFRDAVLDSTGRKVGLWSHRQFLMLWPVNEGRTALLEPVLARDTDKEFGPPRAGRLWYVDHPIGTTVQTPDGAWRHLLAYRGRESQPARGDCEEPTPHTGLYVEEVLTSGPPREMWRF